MIAVPADAAETAEDARAFGWGTAPADHVLAYVDPIEDQDARPAGESDRGIALYRHPEAMLRDEPELAVIVRAYRDGVRLPTSITEWRQLGAFDGACLRIMQAAEVRELRREAKKGGD